MAANQLENIIQLIDALSDADRQKLARYLDEKTARDQDIAVRGSAARLLEAAEKMGYSSGQTDVSERSREILNTEFGDYLLNRLK